MTKPNSSHHYWTTPRLCMVIGAITSMVLCQPILWPIFKAGMDASDNQKATAIRLDDHDKKLDVIIQMVDHSQYDIAQIKRALKIPDYGYPATVTAIPAQSIASGGPSAISPAQAPYLNNILTHNTRAENQARRAALGLPPAPSKAGLAANAKELSGNNDETANDADIPSLISQPSTAVK